MLCLPWWQGCCSGSCPQPWREACSYCCYCCRRQRSPVMDSGKCFLLLTVRASRRGAGPKLCHIFALLCSDLPCTAWSCQEQPCMSTLLQMANFILLMSCLSMHSMPWSLFPHHFTPWQKAMFHACPGSSSLHVQQAGVTNLRTKTLITGSRSLCSHSPDCR